MYKFNWTVFLKVLFTNQAILYITTANFPPKIQNENTSLEVMKGNNYTNLTFVTATDQNGDNIFLFLNNDAPSGLSIENVTGALSWMDVPDLDTASLIITASDGTATSIWTPQIKYCKCQVSIYDDIT